MTTCLVTGGGGFLGQYLVEQLLAQGESVRSMSRNRYEDLGRLGVEQIQGDIRDCKTVIAACKGVDVVFHTAAIAGIWGPWTRYFEINTLGTRNVIAACQRQAVSRLVYSSSPSVTFAAVDQCHVDESAAYTKKWLCHYPHTKALAEQEVLAANSDSLRTCALRPHLIWGPRDRHLIPRLLARARAGSLRIVGSGTNLIDTVFVENAAQAHLQAATALGDASSGVGGRAYFISQGEPVNCWDWINEILRLAELAPVKKRIPFWAAWRIGQVMEMLYSLIGRTDEPRMTRFLAAQLATSHYFDITRAREDFGYSPRISLAEGMERLANWYRTG